MNVGCVIAHIGVNLADCAVDDVGIVDDGSDFVSGSFILDEFSIVVSVIVNSVTTGMIAWRAR